MSEKPFRAIAFDESDIIILDRAVRLAWERFLKTGRMNALKMADAQKIAEKVINQAADGERDPWRLSRQAVIHLWELKFSGTPLIKIAPRRERTRLRRAR